MADKAGLTGLNCPKCGGVVGIPEGQRIVACPFCEQRAIVAGERGLRRMQVAVRVERDEAESRLKRFLSSSPAIDSAALRKANLDECFLVFMPFWEVSAHVMGAVFGERKVQIDGKPHYHPIESLSVEHRRWNFVAADIGALGVQSLRLDGISQVPFDYDELHMQGMVFEPVSSFTEARATAHDEFEKAIIAASGADRLKQVLVRNTREQVSLVYYPLWVLRYGLAKRVYPVVVDGASGDVLYGKAPGNTLHRAFALVSSSAIGTFLMVDIPLLLLWFGVKILDADDDIVEWILGGAAASFAAGLTMLRRGYKRFRYGEHFEYPKDLDEK